MSAPRPTAAEIEARMRFRATAPQPISVNPSISAKVGVILLLDQLVGSGEQRWRNGEAECFCGFEVDD